MVGRGIVFRIFGRMDWLLLLAWGILVIFGLVTIAGIGPAARPFLIKQIWFSLLGLLVILSLSLVDYRVFKNYSLPVMAAYLASVFLLVLTLGSSSVRGVNAWISFGFLRLEPSEIAKLALVILLAKYFSQKHVEIHRIRHLVVSGLYVALMVGLVLLQPDLGSAFVFFLIWLAMLLAAGIKRRHLLLILIGTVLVGIVGSTYFLAPYQKNRLISFLNPYLDPQGEGYSIIQSKTAIGSGGLWGNGFGKGTQSRFGFLPEAHTDFIFAAFAEQFGFAGVLACLALLVFLLWRVVTVGFSSRNNFSRLFSLGFATFIFAHTLVNAGMNLGLLPITGIPFPFLSYGGSFSISLAAGMGLIASISRHA